MALFETVVDLRKLIPALKLLRRVQGFCLELSNCRRAVLLGAEFRTKNRLRQMSAVSHRRREGNKGVAASFAAGRADWFGDCGRLGDRVEQKNKREEGERRQE